MTFCGCTARFVPNLVGNPGYRVSRDAARELFQCRRLLEKLSSIHGNTEPHYANMPVQYTAIFYGRKNDNFQMKFFDIFLIFAQNIDCGYTLEPPQRGGSNEYPQSMFWSKNKKNIFTRVNPTFSI